MKKIILSLILVSILIIININITPVYASEEVQEVTKLAETAGDLLNSGQKFVEKGEAQQNDTIDMDAINDGVSYLYNVLLSVGFVIAIIIGIIIGMKFMMSSSADEKAEYKKTIVVYTVGVIVIFGAYGIWKIIINIMNDIQPQGTGSTGYNYIARPQVSSSVNYDDEYDKMMDKMNKNMPAGMQTTLHGMITAGLSNNGQYPETSGEKKTQVLAGEYVLKLMHDGRLDEAEGLLYSKDGSAKEAQFKKEFTEFVQNEHPEWLELDDIEGLYKRVRDAVNNSSYMKQ